MSVSDEAEKELYRIMVKNMGSLATRDIMSTLVPPENRELCNEEWVKQFQYSDIPENVEPRNYKYYSSEDEDVQEECDSCKEGLENWHTCGIHRN